jgi:hypothetical protein
VGQADRAEAASARAKRLQPRLTKLSIEPLQPTQGLTILRNGVAIGPAQWSTAVPVDAGSYRIEADAPGKLHWSGNLVVSGEGQVVRFQVPVLQAATLRQPGATPAPGTGPTAPADKGVSTGTIAGLTIAGVGVIGIGVGVAFGLIAMSKKNEVDELCPDESKCTTEGIDINDEAKTAGTVSTVAFIAGGVLLVGGIVLWLVAPSGDDVAKIEIGPTLFGEAPGALLRATF